MDNYNIVYDGNCNENLAKLIPFYTSSPNFRKWEYAKALEFMGQDPSFSYLSVGAWNCVLTLVLSQTVKMLAVDINSSIIDCWRTNFSQYNLNWGSRTWIIPGTSVSSANINQEFDRVFAISSLEHAPGDDDIASIEKMSKLLKPGGLMFITSEWGEEYIEDDPVVGGKIYSTDQVIKRLIKPSGLTVVGDLNYHAPDWNIIKSIDPRFLPPYSKTPFAPMTLCMRKDK